MSLLSSIYRHTHQSSNFVETSNKYMGNCISVSIQFDSFFSLCQNCMAKTAAYQCNLEDNLDALQTEFQKLIEARNDLMTRVDLAERKQMKRTEQVQGWLSRVQAVEAEVGEIVNVKSQEIEKVCLGGFCSKNCKSSYRFGKKVAKMLQFVTALKGEGAFKVVAVRVEAVVDEMPSVPTIVGLQSTFDKVWRCLEEEQVGIIGLYGMGGVGKTTLLTQINNKFLDTANGFHVVIWVLVSKNQQLEAIQDSIGKKISLFNKSWKNKNLDEKASDIFRVLSKKKFVVLLDDLWDRVDLMKIGIPLPTPKNSSKVVFTTRILEVCGKMDSDKKFKVECLTHERAWELFQLKVGEDTLNSHPRIRDLAETVTKECDGLPLALITVGRAMACKKMIEEWEYAIQVLRKSASEFAGMEEEVYCLLKFSYDSLPKDKIRSCLLYCSLFPEDYSIFKRDLIDCWISEGILDGNDRTRAQNEGHHIIGILLHACLLEEGKNEDFVKMHDVIRDMSLWIACEIEREKQNFLVDTSIQLTEAPEIRKWKEVTRISLMENQIEELSVTHFCPHLLTLFVNRNHLRVITSGFFQFMPSLRVLNLSNNRNLTELPSGVSKLVSLQHLDVTWTAIKELPKELKVLSNLKCLILENTRDLQTVPRQLISSLSGLRILRMFSHYTSSQVGEDSVLFGGCELLIEELLYLTNLNEVSITLKSFHALDRLLSSYKLQSCTRFLSLKNLDNSKLLDVLSLANMMGLEVLSISDSEKLEELKIDCTRGVREPHAFHGLVEVDIFVCSKLKDLTWLVFAPNLKFISVTDCYDMEEIISFGKLDEVPERMDNLNPFAKLEFLMLKRLQNLKSIYWNAFSFQRLIEISIRQCPKLKKLPLHLQITKNWEFLILGEENWWKELQWEDQATEDAFSPCFESNES